MPGWVGGLVDKYIIWRQLPVRTEIALPKIEYLHNDEHALMAWFWKPNIVGCHIFKCEQDAKDQLTKMKEKEHSVLMVYGEQAMMKRNFPNEFNAN